MAAHPKVTKKIRKETKTDAVIALAGAEYIREKLYSLFDMGPNPISRMAYAVKVRVKSQDRLEEKVIDRRFFGAKPNPEYRAHHVTDIVGVRLIAIYSDSLFDICSRLLDIIRFAQNANIQLFQGSSLQDCINEIIVYTSKNSSQVYQYLYKQFSALTLPPRSDGTLRVKSQPSPDSKPYSSVHIVLNALSYSTKSPKAIPIEIQVRTIFEDTWAEVDHPLIYKGDDFQAALGKKQKVRPGYDKFFGEAKESVRQLKDELDILSRRVDSLPARFSNIDDIFGVQEKSGPDIPILIAYARHDLDHLHRRGDTPGPIHQEQTPTQIKKQLNLLNEQIAKYYEQPRHKLKLNIHIDTLTTIINEANTIIDYYSSNYPSVDSVDHDARYFLYMEKALALLWRCKIVGDLKHIKAINYHDDVNEAINIYCALDCALDNSGECPNDPLVVFRLANAVLLKGGHIDYAINILEEANQRVLSASNHNNIDRLQVAVPRQYAYVLWRKKGSSTENCQSCRMSQLHES